MIEHWTTKKNCGVDKTINNLTKTLEKNIADEVEKLNFEKSVWEKISKSKFKDIVKVAIEAVLKGVLKKKFNINYKTFDEAKEVIKNAMDGNLKEAIKSSSDIAVDKIPAIDSTSKLAIKRVKNAVIDKTIDSEKYEIINKQTKVLNRISKNCDELDEALNLNEIETIKKKATAIKKDLKEILPIRETINRAQNVLDQYELWKNKGEKRSYRRRKRTSI